MTPTVLIIDGDTTFCQLTMQLLEPLQIKVSPSHLGQPGFDLAAKEKPDLVILSAELADMNGYMVCKMIRENPATAHAKVIITSSTAKEDDFLKHKKLRGRADQYLMKPITERDMLFHVSEQLGLNLQPKVFTGEEEDLPPGMVPAAQRSDVIDPAQLHDASLDFLNAIDSAGQKLSTKKTTKDPDASQADLRFESQRQRIDYLEKELEAFQGAAKEIKAVRAENAANEKLIEELRRELSDMEAARSEAHEDLLADLRQEIDELREKVGAGENREQDLKAELAKAVEEKNSHTSGLARAEQQAAKAQAGREDVERRLKQASENGEQLAQENRNLASQLKEAENALKQSRTTADALQAESKRAREERENAAEELRLLKGRLKEQEFNTEEAQKNYQHTRSERDALATELTGLKKQAADAEKARKAALANHDEVKEKLVAAEDSLKEINNRLKNQASSIAELEAEKEGFSAIRKDLERDLAAVRKEKDGLHDNFSREFEAIKSDHRRELADKTKDLNQKVEMLTLELQGQKGAHEERLKALGKDQVEQQEAFNAKQQELREKLAEAQRESHDQKEMTFFLNKKIKTQEEAHLQELERLRAANDTEKSRIQLQAEEDQNRIRAEFQKRFDDLNKKIEAYSASDTAYAAQVTQLEKRSHDIEMQRKSERESSSAQIHELQNRMEQAQAELKKIKESEEKLRSQCQSLELQHIKATADHQKALDEIGKKLGEQLAAESRKLAQTEQERDKLKAESVQLAELKKSHQTLTAEMDKLKLGHDSLKVRLEGTRKVLEAGLKEIAGTSMDLDLELEED